MKEKEDNLTKSKKEYLVSNTLPFLEKIVCLPISIAGGFLGGVAGYYLANGVSYIIIDSPEKIYTIYGLTTIGTLIGSVHSYLSAREIFFKKSWYE